MNEIVNFIIQHQVIGAIILLVGMLILLLSIVRVTTNITASNRGVSAGRDINAPVITGDIGGKSSNIVNIIGLVIGAATLYVTYLSYIK